MNPDFTQTAVLELVARFAIDVVAMVVLVFGMYYRRYRDKELVTAAALFNVFAFAVLTILSNVQFSVAAGFGLFAILALFSLRSEQISKTEITYFFGSIAIAVICSVQGTTIAFAAASELLRRSRYSSRALDAITCRVTTAATEIGTSAASASVSVNRPRSFTALS